MARGLFRDLAPAPPALVGSGDVLQRTATAVPARERRAGGARCCLCAFSTCLVHLLWVGRCWHLVQEWIYGDVEHKLKSQSCPQARFDLAAHNFL